MKRILPALAAAVMLAGVIQTVSAAKVREIKNHGPDGDATYYSIVCSNGADGSVAVYNDQPKVCATPNSGGMRCKRGWSLESAAAYACR